MHFLDDAIGVLGSDKPMMDDDSSNYKNTFFGLHLAAYITA